ncbi:Para-aminobenzoate synthase, aminase component [hydrothermal vent metagenome]|uniref:Para-aminobenzoate synthase, aminase component n=1 Tax=hydrothermal vent metagenome TaxID=652676 RepID=A0A3B0ZNQ2_9ZZZZ
MVSINGDGSGSKITSTNKKLSIVTCEGCCDLLALHASNKKRYPFLLQSTSSQNKNSRFDILFAFPQHSLTLNNNFKLYVDNKLCANNNFLEQLDQLFIKQKTTKNDEQSRFKLPFTGGWFLYLAYELLGQIENKVKTHILSQGQDIAVAVRIPSAIIYDRHEDTSYLLSECNYKNNILILENDYKKYYKKNNDKNKIHLFQLKDLINTATEEPAEVFFNRIKKVKKYIHEGDIFQANLSREWCISIAQELNSTELYTNLTQKNPSAFSGILYFGELTIISSSPERLIQIKNGFIEARPIAGTSKRVTDKKTDIELATNLLNHPKEKAEHIMLVDMERNDLGRVCKAGTVKLSELMMLESLAHVHHIISNIKGELKSDVTPAKIIKAVFPGGSITGCPKVRCMEIIHELEGEARNSYTGSMGYLNNNGDMDLNILIRTIEHKNSTLSFRTGAGIVNDSIPENELEETRIKAKGLLSAIYE